MKSEFLKVVKNRRTYYSISKSSPISDAEIEDIINFAVKHTPSAFNSQSARILLLLGKENDEFWDIVKETLRAIVPAENFDSTDKKIDSFKSGYGSVLFFEDQSVISSLQEKFELYKDVFPVWSLQSAGMLQFTIWSALEEAGFGASLQHYNPLIDDKVKSRWELPESWGLLAQMPFGVPTAGPGEKEFQPLDSRIKIAK